MESHESEVFCGGYRWQLRVGLAKIWSADDSESGGSIDEGWQFLDCGDNINGGCGGG